MRPPLYFFFEEFRKLDLKDVKNVVFLDVAPCGSCKNRRFGGKHFLLILSRKSASEQKR
jgi:hypothetical protein